MTRSRPFEAVIADMDGVITNTAVLHERTWKRTFDDFLRLYDGQRPFDRRDYREYVDGKPRYAGVADFLASRDIILPRGEPSDAPDVRTICGLGNRKNELFLELLSSETVEVFTDAVVALEHWRRSGLAIAVVSSSRNCRRVLKAAGLAEQFDVIVDGQIAVELSLNGKPEILLEAARRLAVDVTDAVVFEDAVAGVSAAKRDGFGCVVGVDRTGNAQALYAAGADVVTNDISRVRIDAQHDGHSESSCV